MALLPRMKEADSFNERFLASKLTTEFDLAKVNRLYVAFSGGLDSTVLLHALINSDAHPRARITALHVNHGANPAADEWQRKCQRMCEAWDVTFEWFRLNRGTQPAASGEAHLRRQRYACFTQLLTEADVLLTAHHQNDQADQSTRKPSISRSDCHPPCRRKKASRSTLHRPVFAA